MSTTLARDRTCGVSTSFWAVCTVGICFSCRRLSAKLELLELASARSRCAAPGVLERSSVHIERWEPAFCISTDTSFTLVKQSKRICVVNAAKRGSRRARAMTDAACACACVYNMDGLEGMENKSCDPSEPRISMALATASTSCSTAATLLLCSAYAEAQVAANFVRNF